MPAVSVIIPVWNRATVVNGAVESVLSQVLPAGWTIQLIIVDDGSADDVTRALKKFGDRVSVLRHKHNSGAAAARNTGVAAATGEYVAFLDSDDVWLPGKLSTQLNVMIGNGWEASCTAFRLVEPGRRDVLSPRYRSTRNLTRADLVWGCYVSPGSTLMVRRAVFEKVGLLDVTLKRFEDWDWLLRYTGFFPLGFVAQPLARIELRGRPDRTAVVDSLRVLQSKQDGALSSRERRHFAAGMDVEYAAAQYWGGRRLTALLFLVRSFLRVPIGNQSLVAILHNLRRKASATCVV